MTKDIKEIRAIPGFNDLTQPQKAKYIEHMHDVLADISVIESVQLLRVEPDPENQPNDVLIHIIRNGEKETYPSGCFL